MLIEYASIHPARLVSYLQSDNPGNYTRVQKLTGADVRQASQNLLSKQSRKNLQLALKALLFLAKWKCVYQKATDKTFRFKVNFVTVTLPAATTLSDKEI